MNKFKFLLLAAVFTVYGCEKSNVDNVDTVKNYVFDFYKTMSIGTAIETSPDCAKTEWKDESTEEQKLVAVNCHLKQADIDSAFDREVNMYQKHRELVESKIKIGVDDFEKLYKDFMTKDSPEFDMEKLINFTKTGCQVKNEVKVDRLGYKYDLYCDEEALRKEFNLAEERRDIYKNIRKWKDEVNSYKGRGIFHLIGNYDLDAEACDYYPSRGSYAQGCMKYPTKLESSILKYVFIINEDNSVNLSKIVRIDNDKARNIGEFFGKVYGEMQKKAEEILLRPFYPRY